MLSLKIQDNTGQTHKKQDDTGQKAKKSKNTGHTGNTGQVGGLPQAYPSMSLRLSVLMVRKVLFLDPTHHFLRSVKIIAHM